MPSLSAPRGRGRGGVQSVWGQALGVGRRAWLTLSGYCAVNKEDIFVEILVFTEYLILGLGGIYPFFFGFLIEFLQ